MGDKDKPNIFNGKQELFFAEIGDKVFKKLPIVENSVEYSGYYDAPELRKSMDSISYNFKTDNPDMTQFGNIFGAQIQSQIDSAVRSSVIVQTEPYIYRPKNLKYPNKKRARRIWKKWRNRYGVRPSKQVVIPRAVISFKPEFKNNQLYNNVEIVVEKVPE